MLLELSFSNTMKHRCVTHLYGWNNGRQSTVNGRPKILQHKSPATAGRNDDKSYIARLKKTVHGIH